MPALFFTNAALLAGLVALGIPILIHLLLKQQRKKVRFSTIQFFLKQDEQTARRRKLRNLLLLATRLLLFALLVLAFARPYLPNGGAGAPGEKPHDAIFVLDQSLSMQAIEGADSRWSMAKAAITKALRELKAADRAALIGCSTRTEVISPLAPAGVVARKLEDLPPSFAAGDLADGLQQAIQLLRNEDRSAGSTIYIVSDLQRNASQGLASRPIPTETKVKVLNIGDSFAPNLAITDFKVSGGLVAGSRVEVANFSDEASAPIKLSWRIDGKEAGQQPFRLAAGAYTNVEFTLPAVDPGWHDLEVRLDQKDALPADNVRYQTYFVPEPARMLIGEGRPSQRSFEEESFFLTAALDPSLDSTNRVQSSFTFDKAAPQELASKLTGRNAKLGFNAVLLPALKQVPSGLGQALLTFAQAGGGVLFFLGDGISVNRYNSEFRDLLPAQLGNSELLPDSSLGWQITQYDTNSVPFAAFRLPNSANLSLPRFVQRFGLTPHENSSIHARFDDGLALVVARSVGAGRVLLVNTSADTSWSDWPKYKSFVPWLHGTGQYLAGAKGQSLPNGSGLIAGGDSDFDLGPAAKGLELKLQRTGGAETNALADANGWLKGYDLPLPGLYSIRNSTNQMLARFGVNTPAEESDLSGLSAKEFEQNLARVSEPQATPFSASLLGAGNQQRDLWRALLLAALVLLFLEMFLANRTRA